MSLSDSWKDGPQSFYWLPLGEGQGQEAECVYRGILLFESFDLGFTMLKQSTFKKAICTHGKENETKPWAEPPGGSPAPPQQRQEMYPEDGQS